jgi:hypothetical protein
MEAQAKRLGKIGEWLVQGNPNIGLWKYHWDWDGWDCPAFPIFVRMHRFHTLRLACAALFAFLLMAPAAVPTPPTSLPGNEYCELKGAVFVEEVESFAKYKVFIEDVEAFADLMVYRESSQSFADRAGLWYFTDVRAFADFTVAFTDVKAFANFSIFFTDFKSIAGCRK